MYKATIELINCLINFNYQGDHLYLKRKISHKFNHNNFQKKELKQQLHLSIFLLREASKRKQIVIFLKR